VSSCLTAHQHKTDYSVPLWDEAEEQQCRWWGSGDCIYDTRCSQYYLTNHPPHGDARCHWNTMAKPPSKHILQPLSHKQYWNLIHMLPRCHLLAWWSTTFSNQDHSWQWSIQWQSIITSKTFFVHASQTRTQTHARTHARTHTHTHTDVHRCNDTSQVYHHLHLGSSFLIYSIPVHPTARRQ